MELNAKNYRIKRVKNRIKTNRIFFLFSGNTMKSYDWIIAEQILLNLCLKYYKISGKTTVNSLSNSIFQKTKATINNVTFFVTPYDNAILTKQLLLDKVKSLFFNLFIIKINNKIYSTKQLKNINSLKYKTNKLLIYQFGITHSKFYYNFSK
jgi:hypothetical protein